MIEKLKWSWVNGEKTLLYSVDGKTYFPVGSDPKPAEPPPPDPDPEETAAEDFPHLQVRPARKSRARRK